MQSKLSQPELPITTNRADRKGRLCLLRKNSEKVCKVRGELLKVHHYDKSYVLKFVSQINFCKE